MDGPGGRRQAGSGLPGGNAQWSLSECAPLSIPWTIEGRVSRTERSGIEHRVELMGSSVPDRAVPSAHDSDHRDQASRASAVRGGKHMAAGKRDVCAGGTAGFSRRLRGTPNLGEARKPGPDLDHLPIRRLVRSSGFRTSAMAFAGAPVSRRVDVAVFHRSANVVRAFFARSVSWRG